MTTDDGMFSINFGSGQTYDLDYVRSLRKAFMPDGEHAWVISVVHGIDDPDKAMDDMSLDADSFVGVTAIKCLLCGTEYAPEIRHFKCSQKWETT